MAAEANEVTIRTIAGLAAINGQSNILMNAITPGRVYRQVWYWGSKVADALSTHQTLQKIQTKCAQGKLWVEREDRTGEGIKARLSSRYHIVFKLVKQYLQLCRFCYELMVGQEAITIAFSVFDRTIYQTCVSCWSQILSLATKIRIPIFEDRQRSRQIVSNPTSHQD